MRRFPWIEWDAAAAAEGISWCAFEQKVMSSVKQGYRLVLVDKDGVLVTEFQLTDNDLADPKAFVAALKQAIEDVEEEEP